MAKADGKVYVVTGANKGIGLCIVRSLCKTKAEGDVVYLCSRDNERGEAAVKLLQDEGLQPTLALLDLETLSTIEALAAHIKETHGGLDALVNNAGVAFQTNSDVPLNQQCEGTVNTNFFGTLNVCKHLFPLLRPHARVVNIGSQAGHMIHTRLNPELLQRLESPDLKMSELSGVMKEYVLATKSEDVPNEPTIWPTSPYAFSKLAVHYMTILQQKLFDIDPEKDVIINAVCPGFCNTDFTSGKGPRPAEEGAITPVYCAKLPAAEEKNPKGQFLFDKEPLELGSKVLPIFKQKPLPEKLTTEEEPTKKEEVPMEA